MKKIKGDGAKNDDFVSFYSEGEVEVDDELEGICDEWWQTACEVESPLNSRPEKLLYLNKFMQMTSLKSGAYCLKVSEGWDFNVKNLQERNDYLYCDGERIDDDCGASKLINGSAMLRIPSLSRMGDSAVLSMRKS